MLHKVVSIKGMIGSFVLFFFWGRQIKNSLISVCKDRVRNEIIWIITFKDCASAAEHHEMKDFFGTKTV